MSVSSGKIPKKQRPNRELAKQLNCKRCGTAFECNVKAIEDCSCQKLYLDQNTLLFLQKTNWGCLCNNCLTFLDDVTILTKEKNFPKVKELTEGLHYYMDGNLYVFTEAYHILRGSCCKSGCKHCPYGFRKG